MSAGGKVWSWTLCQTADLWIPLLLMAMIQLTKSVCFFLNNSLVCGTLANTLSPTVKGRLVSAILSIKCWTLVQNASMIEQSIRACSMVSVTSRWWQIWSSIPAKNQSRSQHSTWECNIWLDKDQHSTLQFNFVVLNAIVKTLDFNFISESSTLNFVHQRSSLRINIALNTCAFSERWTLNYRVNCWVTKITTFHFAVQLRSS